VKRLSVIINPLESFQIFGGNECQIKNITDDSRKVVKGSLFVAIKGLVVDAHKFIPRVIDAGAAVVVGEEEPKKFWLKKIIYIKVPDSRKALGLLSSAWYDYPSKKLKVIGVTGTDGKTTTATLIYWLLNTTKIKTGLVTTVSAKIGGNKYSTGLHVTNPGPLILQKFLHEMVKANCTHAVLEVTSHGLDQKRTVGIDFDIGVLTNITHEHLDYHKTYKNYLRVKAKLFQRSKLTILNREDKSFEKLKRIISTKIEPYGKNSLKGELKKVVEKKFKESYNQMNATAAILAVKELGIGIKDNDLELGIRTFPGVIGRLEEIKNRRGIKVFVDFAHTPNALENVLTTLKKRKGKNRLITVFGCAGERDTRKRPMMAKISTRLADLSVFTAEDPRHEDLHKIIKEMERGVLKSNRNKYIVIPERSEAIAYAIQKAAKRGDIVVICGKGHEKSMAYGDIEYPWSDQEVVKRALTHVHFMGICGSGMSAVAMLAHGQGYEVSGCDLQGNTPYLNKIKNLDIQVYKGHNVRHLKNVDILAVSPAVLFQNKKHPEVVQAQKLGKLMTWQSFLGKYLQKDKKVICIAGTHGKSTTTAMASLLFERAGKNPNVMIGAVVPQWKSNFRIGRSEIFITEADEFFDNFLNYKPDIIILNNIEMDHPDFFKSKKQLFESYKKFVENLVGDRILIINNDSLGIKKLLKMLDGKFLKSIKLIKYSLKDWDNSYKLQVLGKHNKSNALGVITLAKLFKIEKPIIKKSLLAYKGIGRRMEFLGEKHGIKVYDDYAHHPTEIKATLSAFRERFSKKKIVVVDEPHSYSRTKVLLPEYKNVFKDADKVIIGPIFKARDKETFGISGQSIVDVSNHGNIEYLDSKDKILSFLKEHLESNSVVIVMGAGFSYKWAREILKNL